MGRHSPRRRSPSRSRSRRQGRHCSGTQSSADNVAFAPAAVCRPSRSRLTESGGQSGGQLDASQNLAHLRLSRMWKERRKELERLFLNEDGPLGNPESQRDFEAFFERYLGFLQRQPADYGLPPDTDAASTAARTMEVAQPSNCSAAQRAAMSLPRAFDQRFKQNCVVAPAHGGASDGGLDFTLFQGAMNLYQDFCQRQAMQKIRKLQACVHGLPAASTKDQIIEAIRLHSVVLVAGDTGCGKSTQVPQYLLEAGFQKIVVTQPRRIAAVSLARRVAHERLQGKGNTIIGHQIRFDSTRSHHTRVLFVTEGILLRLLEADVEASDFDVVVIDEVHERHLSVDLLLGILRQVIQDRRPDLKLVLMSATLQQGLFAEFFGLDQSAVVNIPGRCFTVEVENIELPDEPQTIRTDIIRRQKKRSEFDCAPFLEVLRRIESRTSTDERGDVLIFVPGAFEIDALVAAIAEFADRSKRWIALPLHSQLPLEQQDRVFDIAPQGVRKVVVATNIAETSVTIDGVRFVVDSGKMKELDVDTVSSVRHLAERWVSRASAEQRKGRAGRTGPGRCYRLFSHRLYGEMEAFTVPEIHRTALETPLLQVLALGFELHPFRFPESPRLEAAAGALQRLLLMRAVVRLELDGAVSASPSGAGSLVACGGGPAPSAGGWAAGFGLQGGEALLRNLGLLERSVARSRLALTPLGRVLSRLPVQVGVGKMLLLALVFAVHSAAVVLAGAANLHSPRVQKRGERSEGSWPFDHRLGDLFTTLQVYQAWLHERSRRKGGSDMQSRRWARENGIDETILFELNKLNVQLCDLLRDSAGQVQGSGSGLGRQMRRDRMARLEAALAGEAPAGPAAAGDLSAQERAALQAELDELRQRESQRQRRQLAFDEGAGALVEDERGLGYSIEDKVLGGGDSEGDVANASGGENNPNRELNRRRRRPGRKLDRGKARLPRNDGLSERMRRRNIEFELKYGVHMHTSRALEPLTGRQEELLQLVVACAFYPNLALPHERNHEKTSSECVFHTRQVPFANLHPSSSLYPELPTTLSSVEGLAFGAILQTHMPFLLHVTRCPVLPVLLLCSSMVDVSTDCKMLIFDEWLQLIFEDCEDVLCLLAEAHCLRRAVQRALNFEITELFEAECDDDVPEDLLEPEVVTLPAVAPTQLRHALRIPPAHLQGRELEDRALALWRQKCRYRWQTLMPNEYAAFLQEPAHSKSQARPSQPANTGWLRFGTISESNVRLESSLVSDHLAMAWTCPMCNHTFRFTRSDIQQHRIECLGDDKPSEGSSGASAGIRDRFGVTDSSPPASTIGAESQCSFSDERSFACDICGLRLPWGATKEILLHKRRHGF